MDFVADVVDRLVENRAAECRVLRLGLPHPTAVTVSV